MPKKKEETKATKPKAPGKTPKQIKTERDKVTRSQAIKAFCIECMGYQKSLVKDCPDLGCPLWPFRKGYGQDSTDVPIRNSKLKK
jgi:hypothetical protein